MSKQKVLIVDDSEMNRALLTDILEGSYDVAEAEDGAQAIEVLSQNDEDFWLVLLDIIMPGIDGFGVLESIREHQWSNRVVVMMISSDGSPENINRAYSLGAFDYISRPFDAMICIDALRTRSCCSHAKTTLSAVLRSRSLSSRRTTTS